MSKDNLPYTVTCDDLLEGMFKYIDDWKQKLYDMMSFNSSTMTMAPSNNISVDNVRFQIQKILILN